MSHEISYKNQYLTAAIATLGSFAIGTIFGFSSPAGAILTSDRNASIIHLTYEQNSWFSSVSNLGAFFGSPLSGICINYFGRRGTIIYSVLPALFGWLLIGAAQNLAMLLVGRIICGFYCSLISVSVPTFIGEFASPRIRGRLGAAFQLMMTIGILYAYSMGAIFNSHRWIALMCGFFPCICSFLMIFSKESPYFLISKYYSEEAEDSLKFFRGKDYDGVSAEMKAIQASWVERSSKKAQFKDLKKPYIMKPLLIALGLNFFQQFCGIKAVLFNLSIIFKDAGSTLSPTVSSIIVGLIQTLGSLTCTILTDKAGRKILLILSSSFMTISLVTLGVYFYFKENFPLISSGITWLPIVSLVVFVFAFCIGFGPITWLMIGELFSQEIKELSAGIATMTNWFCSFIVTLIFEHLQMSIHDSGTFWFFSVFSLASLIFVLFSVYETKGKTLQEINAHFGGPTFDNEEEKGKNEKEVASKL